MIIYNVTSIIEENIQQEYLEYMHTIHMPEVLSTGKFYDAKLFLLTEPQNEGITYCAQYFAKTKEDLVYYREHYSPKLQADIKQKFGNSLLSFRSVLELTQATI
jgi:hypothetical protein